MSRTAAEDLITSFAEAGVQRICGIVGGGLNPATDSVRCNGKAHWVQ